MPHMMQMPTPAKTLDGRTTNFVRRSLTSLQRTGMLFPLDSPIIGEIPKPAFNRLIIALREAATPSKLREMAVKRVDAAIREGTYRSPRLVTAEDIGEFAAHLKRMRNPSKVRACLASFRAEIEREPYFSSSPFVWQGKDFTDTILLADKVARNAAVRLFERYGYPAPAEKTRGALTEKELLKRTYAHDASRLRNEVDEAVKTLKRQIPVPGQFIKAFDRAESVPEQPEFFPQCQISR